MAVLPGGGSHSRAEAVVPGPRSPSAPPAGPSFGLALSGLRSDLHPARGNWPQAVGAAQGLLELVQKYRSILIATPWIIPSGGFLFFH